jgi:homogentisate 1,2-dioxygenase
MERKIVVGTLSQPDERRSFNQGHLDVIKLGETSIGYGVFEPGWKWSRDVQPIAKTASCETAHTVFVQSGRMRVVMDDGEEAEVGPGDCAVIPPGHDAWVVGAEPCVFLDFTGARDYALEAREARPAKPEVTARPDAY